MRDKAWDIFLLVLFAVGGAVVLIVAWTQLMTPAERILTTFIGAIGLLGVSVRAVLLKWRAG